jgi:hypothetical protein
MRGVSSVAGLCLTLEPMSSRLSDPGEILHEVSGLITVILFTLKKAFTGLLSMAIREV